MKYIVEVRLTAIEQELVIQQCPFGTWRSKNGVDYTVKFESREEAMHFFECVDGHGYPVSEVKEIAP